MAKRLANLQPRRKQPTVRRQSRQAQDTTLINLRALKRRVAALEARVDALDKVPGTMPQVDEPLTVTPVPDSGETT